MGTEPEVDRKVAEPVDYDEKEISAVQGGIPTHSDEDEEIDLNREYPTEEELTTLRRVSDEIPWRTLSIAFVELCERFSYYGTTVVFTNFIQRPLPEGSATGSVGDSGKVPGALGMGQQASYGLGQFNSFWSYITPLLGAFIADQYWGRFNTIMYAIACSLVGHVLLIVSALPPVIKNGESALAAFTIGLVIMGLGTGGFKSNCSALIAEQYKESRPFIKLTKKGERVIVDPAATVSRIYHYFYLMINVGALCGQISMVYAEKYVGFWLSFLCPTIMFCAAPVVLFFCKHIYVLTPPAGSIYGKAFKVWGLAMKGRWSINPVATVRNFQDPNMWDQAKPSKIANPPAWMTFDDAWVDEVRRGLVACKVFLWYPLYWLAYNQMLNNLTSMGATMTLNGVPNDIIQNLNSLSLIICIPIMDRIVYPGLRKIGIRFTPLKRIAAGFFTAGCSMISATVLQYYIYKLGPGGDQASLYVDKFNLHAPINVWVQAIIFVLGGISEIFASVTSLEYAFTKAPKNMRSLVQAVALFMNAFSSALGQALVPLAEDPKLVWNYMTVAILSFVGFVGFWATNYKHDKEEDKMNALPEGYANQTNDEEKTS